MATTKTSPSNGHTAGVYEETALPPNNREAEAALIGSVLIDPDRFTELDLEPIMFFDGFYRNIYASFLHLREQKQPIDFVTVSGYLNGKGVDKDAELVGLLTVVPTSVNLLGYARIVKEMYNRRRLISMAGRLATNAYDPDASLDSTVADALEEARIVGGESSPGEPISSYAACEMVLNTLEDRREKPKLFEESMLYTGFVDLDRLLEGLEPGSLVICAARPSMGKSIFEQNIRMNVATKGKRVGAFNLEMTIPQLMFRSVSSRLKMPYKSIFNPSTLTAQQWANVNKAIGEFSTWPMYLDDTPSLSIDQFNSKAHRLVAQYGHFDLFTIDYLQLMYGRPSARSRVEEIGQISSGLKRTAKELNTVIWANAQINRSVESRMDKHPILADLRGSGDMEQDADVVIFIYRDVIYNPETERHNIAELDVAKNRNGNIGQADLFFSGENMMFRNLSRTAVDF